MNKIKVSIAIIIATCNRPYLLQNRALNSVKYQTRKPDYIIVVDDSDKKNRTLNEEIVSEFRCGYSRVIYLENYRTKGVSGAWNTAFSELLKEDQNVIVAILDDDDEWDKDYLKKCERLFLNENLDMVISGIIRFDNENPDGLKLSIPQEVKSEDFLIENPHIQGSNLFIKLKTILEAGAFDEALSSTTDRDLCIRICDLGYVKIGFLREYLVKHFAFSNYERLSTPFSQKKGGGLRTFYRKYKYRMNEHQKEVFIKRSKKLFGIEFEDNYSNFDFSVKRIKKKKANFNFQMLIGFITSPLIKQTQNLLEDINNLALNNPNIIKEVIIVENSGDLPEIRNSLKNVLKKSYAFEIVFYPYEMQKKDIERLVFGKKFTSNIIEKSIAASRTMLQRYLYQVASSYENPVIWILDDDSRLEIKYWDKKNGIFIKKWNFFDLISLLREKKVDVVLGTVTGAPPLPFASCIRTQLVDLYHNLERLSISNPLSEIEDLEFENIVSRMKYHDYYYDLSRSSTNHLEIPFWFNNLSTKTAESLFIDIVNKIEKIFCGEQIFRPILANPVINPFETLKPSINRGGNTLILNKETLNEFQNYVPSFKGKDFRRSDMVWSLLNRYISDRTIVQLSLPITHDRSFIKNKEFSLDFDKLREDIQGYAVYSSLFDIFRKKVQDRQFFGRKRYDEKFMTFTEKEKEEFVRLYKKYFTERYIAFELSVFRILGILKMVKLRYLNKSNNSPWWLESEKYLKPVNKLKDFFQIIEKNYSSFDSNIIKKGLEEISEETLEQYCSNLYEAVYDYRFTKPIDINIINEAKNILSQYIEVRSLKVLGIGKEAIILTDNNKVYKIFINKNILTNEQINFLKKFGKNWNNYSTIYPIELIETKNNSLILSYPFERGEKVKKIDASYIIKFLLECKDAGIVSNNVHPDNFILTQAGLRFIDYGRDLHPFNIELFRKMCHRAFLSYKYPNWLSLKSLMTKSIHNEHIPELYRFNHFLKAINPRKVYEILYPFILKKIEEISPNSILDYGCGKGKVSETLSKKKFKVVGFDPDKSIIQRCKANQSNAIYYDSREKLSLIKYKFDLVLNSLVLCILENNNDLELVLKDLRRYVSENGDILVAICNPFYIFTQNTEIDEKIIPHEKKYNQIFVYNKRILSSDLYKKHIHRPYHFYVKKFLESNLIINSVNEAEGTNVIKFQPASDFILFHLKPLPFYKKNVILMIKSCSMEWRTIDKNIRHIVKQLEGPRLFKEKVVAVDLYGTKFLRQYDEPNVDEYLSKLEKLVIDGIIDRIIIAPNSKDERKNVNKIFFGINNAASYSVNGTNVYPQLYGFLHCDGEYILQVDSDLIIGRKDSNHDYLGDMIRIFEKEPYALTISFNILNDKPKPYTYFYENNGRIIPWRIEIRASLLCLSRLKQALPFPNKIIKKNGKSLLKLAWYRAIDRLIQTTNYRSYRGGSNLTYFIHPENKLKTEKRFLNTVYERIESKHFFKGQIGKINLTGSIQDWTIPKRYEPFIFIICGRNAEAGKVKDCIDSIKKQEIHEWGAVIIDDASDNGNKEYLEILLEPIKDKITYIRNFKRIGLLKNTWLAITNYCSNPDSIIITLDMDDGLIGSKVLNKIKMEYDNGADVTVGSMLRTDKETNYIADFENPRRKPGGGNVWQHLRSFRKYLFDNIKKEDFLVNGKWIDVATDWVYMLPIVEMSKKPVYIKEKLYYYEPSDTLIKRRQIRENFISKIVSKSEYSKLKRD